MSEINVSAFHEDKNLDDVIALFLTFTWIPVLRVFVDILSVCYVLSSKIYLYRTFICCHTLDPLALSRSCSTLDSALKWHVIV